MRKIKFRTSNVTRDANWNFVASKSDPYFGMFHQWIWNANGETYGLCELENGTIMKVYYEDIVFVKPEPRVPI